MRGRVVGPGDVTANQRGTLRARSRARVEVVSAVGKSNVWWALTLSCGHSTHRPIERKCYAPFENLPPPRHVYCTECPLRREVPLTHEERLADFDARLRAASDLKW